MYAIIVNISFVYHGEPRSSQNLSRDVHAFLDRIGIWKCNCMGETLLPTDEKIHVHVITQQKLIRATLFSWYYAKHLYWNCAKMFLLYIIFHEQREEP